MKAFIKKTIAEQARKVLKKYKPVVVIINGSIGKTSASAAAYAVLSSKYKVRRNIKSYNNEFGVPLTILGSESPKRNAFKWVALLWKGFRLIHGHFSYPEVLILEMGVDRPGDMDYLLKIFKPDRAIYTTAGISHLEHFSSKKQILEEEGKGIMALSEQGYAILNADDDAVLNFAVNLRSKKISYGQSLKAGLVISNLQTSFLVKNKNYGTSFKLSYQGQSVDVSLDDILGFPHVSACAAGVALGLSLGMNLEESADALGSYAPEKARMRVITGQKGSYIIDDTYNSAPLSAKAALSELRNMPVARKIAVLGDMLELGPLSDQSHIEIGDEIMKDSIDYFIGVGPQGKLTSRRLETLGFKKDHIFNFDKSVDAIETVLGILAPNSAVLVKGSQGMRMEKIVKGIMAEPEKAEELLCRQDPEWLS